MQKTLSGTKVPAKRPLDDTMQDSPPMPPPSTPNVARKKHTASRTRVSATTSQDSLTKSGSMQEQNLQPRQEANHRSTTTILKTKEISMATLCEIATNEYPDIPSVMNVAMIQKTREVVLQEELNNLNVRYRFGQIKPAVWRVVRQFRRELSPNEPHSYASLLQHKEFEAMEVEVRAKVKDLRPHGYYSDPLMLFGNFSANLDAVRDSMCYIHRCEGFAQLVLEIQGIELAHRYERIFRAYDMAVTTLVPRLLEYGLTQESQYRLHDEVTEVTPFGNHLLRGSLQSIARWRW